MRKMTSKVEGAGDKDTSAVEAAFEEMREALNVARDMGSITAMRKAVAAFDRFEALNRDLR